MDLLIVLFWVCLILSISSFLIFAAFAAQRYTDIRNAAKIVAPELKKDEDGMGTDPQSVADPDKIIEALAKLTDSLAKAPVSVAALIAAMFFMLMSLGASSLEDKRNQNIGGNTKTSIISPSSSCTVRYFDDGRHQLPAGVDDLPGGCLDALANRLRTEQPVVMLVIGRCDIREMTQEAKRIYGDNLSLAYQRALAVQQYLLGPKSGSWAAASRDVAERAVLLIDGASHIGPNVSPSVRREDRVVELVSFWSGSSAAAR
jgi:hypothetical protein